MSYERIYALFVTHNNVVLWSDTKSLAMKNLSLNWANGCSMKKVTWRWGMSPCALLYVTMLVFFSWSDGIKVVCNLILYKIDNCFASRFFTLGCIWISNPCYESFFFLQAMNVRHHKVGETAKPESYRIKDDLVKLQLHAYTSVSYNRLSRKRLFASGILHWDIWMVWSKLGTIYC